MGQAKAKRFATLLAVALVALASLPAASSSSAAPPRRGGTEGAHPDTIQESTGNQITSFYFGESGQITPVPPVNESHGQELDALGVSFPRFLVSNVGSWQVTLSEEGMIVESLDGLSIWASSTQGAQNVRFTIQVQINGNGAGTLRTETKATLGSNPEEFRIDAGGSQMNRLDFPKGSQLTFNLQYSASSSPLPAGPSGSSTFHYYGTLYRSRVDFVTDPFNLTLSEVQIEPDRVNVTEIFKEAFGVDPEKVVLSLTFTGPTSSDDRHVKLVNKLIDPINGTTLIWNWFFARQGGVSSGQYTIALSGAYVGAESNYTNVTTVEMKIPKVKEASGGFLPGLGALEVGAGLAVAAAVATVGRAGLFAGRKQGRSPPNL